MIYGKILLIWLIIILTEILNGTLRNLLIIKYIDDFTARQIGVFTGSLLILIIVTLSINWIGENSNKKLLLIGCTWVILTLLFEITLGYYILNYSWKKILRDYQINQGGLLPLGLLILLISPLIGKKIQSIISPNKS